MADPLTPEQWLKRLESAHRKEKGQLELYNQHYHGEPPYAYMAPELMMELGDRLQQVVINWPRLVVDTVEERADVEGFRLGGKTAKESKAITDELWDSWQANNLDEGSSQAHTDSLVMRRGYVTVGTNPDSSQPPIVAVESPLEVHMECDPRTRRPVAAYKTWREEPPAGPKVDHAALYLSDRTIWYVKDAGSWEPDPHYPEDVHKLGRVPVVPIVNRPRTTCPLGESELIDAIPLANAANKIATDMMVSAEFHSMPRRWALGFGPEDFEDANGNPVSTWSKIAGRIWATEKTTQEGVQVGQFPEADLSNFHNTLKQLAVLVASLYGLPATYMGLAFDNPPSADGIRSLEARTIKRTERKIRAWSGGWEEVMRLVDRLVTGVWRPELRRLETVWADPATPTVAQKADAAVKLFGAGISTKRQAREDVGYSIEQIERMEGEDAAAAEADPIGQMTKALADMPTAPEPPRPEVTPPEPAPTAA